MNLLSGAVRVLARPAAFQQRAHASSLTRGKTAAALASSVYRRSLADGSLFVSRVPEKPTTPKPNQLPPPLKPTVEKKYHLTEADQAEMRRLREEDPAHWTQKRLAEKFGCSRMFVALVAPCPTGRRAALESDLELVREKHGYKRRLIGLNRQRRRQLW
ncbi:mitochondrial ribosomal protein subunit L20-domain-containing protein [Thamnocephalis sphaerospora]|uniref:Mitochondrial ribosomal protein subunit L20-domain-containing protein n=1 Tax=Thamnocephalis sphaerospora TaxID=78915 RepID=A0A4P9XPY1_9FUNG|nr:mitochondrial ribosomal protein subunit L20-domain-containing protein [Thamnocephalis sphaerospora]|eukprot:RKP07952.1 mitochondrial ribosomal protein subunit L20-domain-containing protein [Thamnocephalis sphaerospora]